MGILKEDVKEAFLIKDRGHDDDPSTFDEVMTDIDFEKWLDAIKLKIDSMHLNQVWTLVDPLKKIIFIGCKWIYKKNNICQW